jgi:prolyl-tRNA synthetase
VFQLGRKYADVFDLVVTGPDGRPAPVSMGCYGIGVTRAVAALAEQHHDELGLCWPRQAAPAHVHLVATGRGDGPLEAAMGLARDLVARGLAVVVDDRPAVSPGVKFGDAELIGVPLIVTVGRGLAHGVVEMRDRWTGDRVEVALEAAADAIAAASGSQR